MNPKDESAHSVPDGPQPLVVDRKKREAFKRLIARAIARHWLAKQQLARAEVLAAGEADSRKAQAAATSPQVI